MVRKLIGIRVRELWRRLRAGLMRRRLLLLAATSEKWDARSGRQGGLLVVCCVWLRCVERAVRGVGMQLHAAQAGVYAVRERQAHVVAHIAHAEHGRTDGA